jgi:hypothetical protein
VEHFADETLTTGVIHNRNTHLAHHDAILHATPANIAVQCKYKFKLDAVPTIQSQQLVKKDSISKVPLLIWLYLGNEDKEDLLDNSVICMSGSGCCSGLALDLHVFLKRLKSNYRQ